MPSKNVLKYFKENSYYHIYNRGVAKQNIFKNDKDYKVFLDYLKIYLSPVDLQGRTLKVAPSRELKNYCDTAELLAYCLMPNHFHLLLFQKDKYSMSDFMRSLGTKYSVYFNRANNRVGPVFQSRYKAVRVIEQDYLVYLSKYIHKNPEEILPTRTDLVGYKYSSYGNYLGRFSQNWVKPKKVLRLFRSNIESMSYKKFVESKEDDVGFLKDKLIDS